MKANEKLAEYSHGAWTRTINNVFKNAIKQSDGFVIPHSQAERWKRQMQTPYEDLHEVEKESNRIEAVRIQEIFFGEGGDDDR